MKKVLTLCLAFMMVLALVGCSSVSDDDKVKMSRVINADLDAAKDGFDSELWHAGSDFVHEHKGASEYHVTGTAHFTNSGNYDVDVFYIFVKQSDGSFYVYSREIDDFYKVD